MNRIDLEAHYLTQDYLTALERNPGYPRFRHGGQTEPHRWDHAAGVWEPIGDALITKLLDVGDQRLCDMDAAGIDVQVLSLASPGVEQFAPAQGTSLARELNDELARLVGKHPDRFVGYATLAPKDPQAAARELERAVHDLGFKGWKTHSNYGDAYLDDRSFWPILETAEELDVPVFLHPVVPAIPALKDYGLALAGASFGFGLEASLCMMRLIHGGVLDAYPRLKIILGHLGEGLPFLLQRIDFAHTRLRRPVLNKKPSDYLKENMFVATSGNYLPAAFVCTLEALGVDRVVLGTDYPYENANECLQFLESVPLTQADREKIYHQNAGRLGIAVPVDG